MFSPLSEPRTAGGKPSRPHAWNDVGEVLMTVGSLAGLVLAGGTAYDSAGRDE